MVTLRAVGRGASGDVLVYLPFLWPRPPGSRQLAATLWTSEPLIVRLARLVPT
jgi:hypothetical protein